MQAASSLMELQTLFGLAGFAVGSAFSGAFCCACAAKANSASAAIVADAPSAFAIAVTFSPDSQEAHIIVWISAARKRKWLRPVARDRGLVCQLREARYFFFAGAFGFTLQEPFLALPFGSVQVQSSRALQAASS